MTTLEILKAARELLSDEKRWTVETYAKDAEDNDVSPLDKRAVCFCSLGALARASETRTYDTVNFGKFWFDLFSLSDWAGGIPQWNDAYNRTHAEVLAKFDEAQR